jgi:hypothetical protein
MTGSALFNAGPGSRPRRELVPGAVHVPAWLTTGRHPCPPLPRARLGTGWRLAAHPLSLPG